MVRRQKSADKRMQMSKLTVVSTIFESSEQVMISSMNNRFLHDSHQCTVERKLLIDCRCVQCFIQNHFVMQFCQLAINGQFSGRNVCQSAGCCFSLFTATTDPCSYATSHRPRLSSACLNCFMICVLFRLYSMHDSMTCRKLQVSGRASVIVDFLGNFEF
jgi:hypothetical protein